VKDTRGSLLQSYTRDDLLRLKTYLVANDPPQCNFIGYSSHWHIKQIYIGHHVRFICQCVFHLSWSLRTWPQFISHSQPCPTNGHQYICWISQVCPFVLLLGRILSLDKYSAIYINVLYISLHATRIPCMSLSRYESLHDLYQRTFSDFSHLHCLVIANLHSTYIAVYIAHYSTWYGSQFIQTS
jgi:hypothetical protein